MLVTVIIVVVTHDLSKGVIAGVILSAIFFVSKISKIEVKKREEKTKMIFEVEGQLFFASVEEFVRSFDFSVENKDITINFLNAHIWDDSAVGAVDKVVIKYREKNNAVTIIGLDSSSKTIVDQLAIYNNVSSKSMSH